MIIITADDFGISPGVNQAVMQAHIDGALTNASLMANGKYLEDAINLAKGTTLKLGLHINLSGGKPVLPAEQVPNLVDKNGNFKYGTVGLLIQTILKPSILRQIHLEIEAQINKLQSLNIDITHLDGHHHVQMVPGIFDIVTKLAAIYKIPRVRVVNESILRTLWQTRNANFLLNSGIIKYAILKSMCIWNRYKSKTYFFSILNSCIISSKMLGNIYIPKGFDSIEIMLHPGNSTIDAKADLGDFYEHNHLTSPYREVELEAALGFGKKLDVIARSDA